MSTDLANIENSFNGFSAFKEAGPAIGLDVNSSDIKLPKIKLMQQTSKEASKSGGKILPGQFYNTVTEEASDTIDCILLDQGKSMVMWPQPFKRGEDPLCRSFDGKVKAEGCGDGNCDSCQYSSQNPKAWSMLPQGATKPPCNMSYVFLAIDTKTNMPFRFIASGASVKNTKAFLNKLLPLGISPFACKVTLTSSQEENDQGIFYVVNFEALRPNDECLNPDGTLIKEKYDELADKSRTYKELFMTQIVQNDVIAVDETADSNSESGALF